MAMRINLDLSVFYFLLIFNILGIFLAIDGFVVSSIVFTYYNVVVVYHVLRININQDSNNCRSIRVVVRRTISPVI